MTLRKSKNNTIKLLLLILYSFREFFHKQFESSVADCFGRREHTTITNLLY